MKFRPPLIVLLLIVSSIAAPAGTDKRDEKKRGSKVERTIAADPAVSVSACLMSGSITVHGWDRNEVRARSTEAVEIQFRRKDESADANPAKKIEVLVADKAQGPEPANSCESFSEIELDVPRGATVQLQTRDSDISVVGVATVYVSTQNGDVDVERATRAVDAGTIGGSISLKDSSGRINLHSAGGSIEASDVRPAEAGDTFEAGSVGGDLTLERVSHAQLSAHTLNGSLCLTGPLAHGGRYNVRTISGDLTLTLPSDSSFKLSARFSQRAEIITDFPITLLPQSSVHSNPSASASASAAPSPSTAPAPAPGPAPKGDPAHVVTKVKTNKGTIVVDIPNYASRRLEGICGSGDATIELASFSGTIHLRKQ